MPQNGSRRVVFIPEAGAVQHAGRTVVYFGPEDETAEQPQVKSGRKKRKRRQGAKAAAATCVVETAAQVATRDTDKVRLSACGLRLACWNAVRTCLRASRALSSHRDPSPCPPKQGSHTRRWCHAPRRRASQRPWLALRSMLSRDRARSRLFWKSRPLGIALLRWLRLLRLQGMCQSRSRWSRQSRRGRAFHAPPPLWTLVICCPCRWMMMMPCLHPSALRRWAPWY